MLKDRILKFYNTKLLEKAIAFSIIFLLFKYFFPIPEKFTTEFFNELLAVHLIYFWMKYVPGKLNVTVSSIMRLYGNVFILASLLLLLSFSFSQILPSKQYIEIGFWEETVVLTISGLVIVLIILIYSSLSKLFFYKQKSNAQSYLRVMAIFTIIVGLTNAFDPFFSSFVSSSETAIPDSFTFVSLLGWLSDFENVFQIALIIIVVINAFRVAWIASLNKTQKKKLVVLSLFLVIIFSALVTMFFENNLLIKTAYLFSPTLFIVSSTVSLYGAVYSLVIFFTALFHIPTAEEADRKSEEYSTFLEFGNMMTQILDFNELSESILNLTKKIVSADSTWMIIDKDETMFYTLGEKSKSLESYSENYFKTKKLTKPEKVVQIKPIESGKGKRYTEILVSPIKLRNGNSGLLFAGFYDEDKIDDDLVNTFAYLTDYAALAIENSEFVNASIENERMEKELEIAREIQMRIVPQSLPEFNNLNACAKFIPAFEVGGDYYDFLNFGDKTFFVIADVSGKGMEASYVMAEMKGVLESLTVVYKDLRTLVVKANEIFIKRLDSKNFITAIFGSIDDTAGMLTYFRLGHNYPIIIEDGNTRLNKSKGLALGITAGKIFEENLEEVNIKMKSGIRILFYTDGLPESKNGQDEEFGYEKLEDLMTNSKDANTLMEQIITDVSLYSKNNIQADDLTILIFENSEKGDRDGSIHN